MDCYAFFLHESGTSEAKAVSPTRGRSAQGDAMSLNLSYCGQIEPINDVMVLCKSRKKRDASQIILTHIENAKPDANMGAIII
jgi:hypothetical protein